MRSGFVLEVLYFYVELEDKIKHDGAYKHVGYMDLVFKTKTKAAEYYNIHNPHMRPLNAHGYWCSDWDPQTRLCYIVRDYYGQCCQVTPFNPRDKGTIYSKKYATITNTTDWGEIHSFQVDQGNDFWCLLAELQGDHLSNFGDNRVFLIEAFRQGTLFSLRVTETDSMYKRKAQDDSVFCDPCESFYLLPALAVVVDNVALLVWVHSRARRLGFGTKLVKSLGVKGKATPLPGSEEFWKACGICEVDYPSSTKEDHSEPGSSLTKNDTT